MSNIQIVGCSKYFDFSFPEEGTIILKEKVLPQLVFKTDTTATVLPLGLINVYTVRMQFY